MTTLTYGLDRFEYDPPTSTIAVENQTCFFCEKIKRGVADREVFGKTYEHCCKDCVRRIFRREQRRRRRRVFEKLG